jgi:hypothetical protein
METCILMTVTKRKITEVESIVNKADNRKTAGKIYLPKGWIGKKVKTVLISSLILLALAGLMTSQTVVAKKFEILGGPGGVIVPASKNKHHSNDDNNRVKIKGSLPISTTPRYITGTVIDCNLVFSFSTYFSQLAIDSCNQQYRK